VAARTAVSAAQAVRRRQSRSSVTADAPTHAQLLPLVAAASGVADHSALRPWRLIELRGAARERLGEAFVAASGLDPHGKDARKLAAKPLRASLLIAIVSAPKPSFKVPEWEQDATAAGVAHVLSLLLDEAGWGVMWRTGGHVHAHQVAAMHDLAEHEKLLGWLYVGGVEPSARGGKPRKLADPDDVLSVLE
jgi:nitroreductase